MDRPRRGHVLSARWLAKLQDLARSGRLHASGRLRGSTGSTGTALSVPGDPSTWARIDANRGGGSYDVTLLAATGFPAFANVRTAIAKEVNGVSNLPVNLIVWAEYSPFADDYRFQCAPCS